jgi:hypothetical protein
MPTNARDMSPTADFFKRGETSFGIFYPTGYALSVFRDDAGADQAAAVLRNAGFPTTDVLVASGAEVLAHSRELRAAPGLLTRFERFVADLYGGEASLADELLGLAEGGHAFVAAYAPHAVATSRAAEAVRSFGPVMHRKFDPFTYTDLR